MYSATIHDVGAAEPVDGNPTTLPNLREQLRGILGFADSVAGHPLLIHCRAGVSRSTAVALALIVRAMHSNGCGIDQIQSDAPEFLLALRPQAAPNSLLLRLALEEFLAPGAATEIAAALLEHAGLAANCPPHL